MHAHAPGDSEERRRERGEEKNITCAEGPGAREVPVLVWGLLCVFVFVCERCRSGLGARCVPGGATQPPASGARVRLAGSGGLHAWTLRGW